MTTLLRPEKVVLPAGDPAPDFDGLAGVYRWMEALSFGPWLSRCRCTFLRQTKGAKLALVLGDGDGRFTERLLRENPQVRVNAVDLSPAMLDALVRRVGDQACRVRTQVADVRTWTPCDERRYDLVVTHFFLDCLTTAEVAALALRVRPRLTENAIWVVSEFAIPEGRFGRWGARRIVGFLYSAFGLMTGLRVRELPDHAGALERTGFRLLCHKGRLRGMLVSELWTRE